MRCALAFALASLATLCCVPVALADGDPASDYLISQQVFLPFTVPVSAGKAAELTRLLDDSKQRGFPVKVAVIAGKGDLGSVPSLYGTPQRYASFLGQEDFYFFKDELLVVMPQGYGLYKHGPAPKADIRALAKLPVPKVTDGDGLVAAAERAVIALAARRGIALSVTAAPASSRTGDRVKIIAGVLILCALAIAARVVIRRR